MLPRLSPGFLARSAGLQVNGILMNASMFFDVDCFSSAPFSIWSALCSCMNACSAYFPAHLAQELLSDTRHTDQDSCAGVDMDTCEGLVLAMLHALLVDSHEGAQPDCKSGHVSKFPSGERYTWSSICQHPQQ